MNIITISREFGSGGRELGKRLADLLGYDYYDREILSAIAKAKGMDEEYVEKAMENGFWRSVPLSFRHSFAGPAMLATPQVELLLEEKRVLEQIAAKGRDFVIVGRNADVYLGEYSPFQLFVCAPEEAKLSRCRERAPEGEKLSDKELLQNVRRIDKNRARTREIITGSKWGDRANYHAIINTGDWCIKELVPSVAEMAKAFFGRSK